MLTMSTLDFPGGRTAGLARLKASNPAAYGRTRNFLDAPVTKLSPYLRHGMLELTEVADHFRANFPAEQVEELLRQLAWRDYFEKVLAWHGVGLDDDLEVPKHHAPRRPDLPVDIATGRTGLPCVDGMVRSLVDDGYLHNHERLWFAAYVCHFRGVRWQAGAELFRHYLLDGDIASNSCSWQWVESTFASKPYFMNKENVAKYSGRRWCDGCTAKCPFDAPYEVLEKRLFGNFVGHVSNVPNETSTLNSYSTNDPVGQVSNLPESLNTLESFSTIAWVHDAAMSAVNPAVTADSESPLVFCWSESWSANRVRFVSEGWADLLAAFPGRPSLAIAGDPAVQLPKLIGETGTTTIHVSDHPNPTVRRTITTLGETAVVHPKPVFVEYEDEPKRFSRYWNEVAAQVLGYRPKSGKRMR
jgi:deoxyribodipyrimidine photo-lyase